MNVGSGPIRVLHVDDKPEFIDVATTFLENENDEFAVETATSADEGLELLAEGAFDCVVSDYDMPGDNGIEFLEAVRAEYPDLPFILFTGKGSEEVAADAIAAGATDYIQKSSGTSQYTVLANRVENAVEQYRARRQMERMNRRHERTLERITDGYTVLDSDLTVVDVNSQTVEFTGLSREELVGTDYRAITAEEGEETFLAAYREVLETGEPKTVTGRSEIYPDRWLKERIFPAEDGDEIFVYFQDVTDRKNRERLQSLIIDISSRLMKADVDSIDRRIETALEHIGEFASAGRCYVFDVYDDGDLMDNTHEWCAPGVEPHKPELQGLDTGAFEWFMPKMEAFETVTVPSTEELPPEAEVLRTTLESGNIESIVTIPLTRGDDLLGFIGLDWLETQEPWSEETIDLLEVSGNIIASALARKETILARERRERRLQDQKAKIEALHDVAADMETCESADAVYDLVVDASESILEFDVAIVEEAQGDVLVPRAVSSDPPPGDYATETPVDDEDSVVAETYRTGEPQVLDDLAETDAAPASADIRSVLSVPVGRHGVYQSVSNRAGAFDEADRELTELLVAHARARLTQLERERELRERTAALERQNERLDEFVSIVSHDLQAPLSVASGNLELAREEATSEHHDDVAAALDRMDRLVEDLLTLAREGERVGDIETVDLGSLVASCWETVGPEAATLVVEGDQRVRADPGRLRQLFENLLSNAIEHGGADVTVTVGPLLDADGFYVADDGRGIPADERDQVFGPGYSTSDDGTGFGLTIVRRIVDAHGWTVEVTESEGGGARFEVSGVEVVDS